MNARSLKILPLLFAVVALFSSCKKNCQNCYLIADGPFYNDNDTLENYHSRRPYLLKNKNKCQELADSLNRDDSQLHWAHENYTYHCTCEQYDCD